MNTRHRHLTKLFDQLDEQDQTTLMAFAEFLAARQPEAEQQDAVPQQPKDIPRPAKESVVAGIKRLSETYPMLDRQDMLNETASLMGAHVMQGRPAADVVDELEKVFRTHYERYLQQH